MSPRRGALIFLSGSGAAILIEATTGKLQGAVAETAIERNEVRLETCISPKLPCGDYILITFHRIPRHLASGPHLLIASTA